MAQVNLLPWREELRSRRQKEFFVTVAIAAVLMLGVIGGVHLHYQDRIEFQGKRNAYIDTQIKQLDKRIAEISNLKRQRQRLLARTEKIQQLQSGRPEVVHLVDELVKTLPDGVYYTKITQKGGRLQLTGMAQSNTRVSSLMRQLDGSEWLQDPGLVEIKADKKKAKGKNAGFRNSRFALRIKQTDKAAKKRALDAKAAADGKKKKKKGKKVKKS